MSVIAGPEDGDLFVARVTVGMTLSADISVRAHSQEEAEELFSAAAKAQYPHGFEVDEGNYRGVSDFYFESREIENLSEPQYDRDGNFSGKGWWSDADVEYVIEMTRSNPDGETEEEMAEVEATLTVRGRNGKGPVLQKTISGYEVHRDDLAEWIEECVLEGDFDEELSKMAEKLRKKMK